MNYLYSHVLPHVVAVLFLSLLGSCTNSDSKATPDMILDKRMPRAILAMNSGDSCVYYVVPQYTLAVVDRGRSGYYQVVKRIRSNPSPEVLSVCLVSLASFHDSYRGIGIGECASYLSEITAIVNELLQSPRVEYRRTAVIAASCVFHDVDDDKTVTIMRKLQSDNDLEIAKLASRVLESIDKRSTSHWNGKGIGP